MNSKNLQLQVQKLIKQGKDSYKKKEPQKSKEFFLQSLEKDPSNLQSHYYLGLIYTQEKDLNQAILHFHEVSESPYTYIYKDQVEILLSYIYCIQGDYKNALFKLQTLSNIEEEIDTLSILGYIYYKEKNYEQSQKYYKKILEKDPNNANAYNSLAMICIETEENLDLGIEYCKKALEIVPNYPAYLDSLGLVYYKKKEFSKAIECLRDAFEQSPDSLEIKEHLKTLLDF